MKKALLALMALMLALPLVPKAITLAGLIRNPDVRLTLNGTLLDLDSIGRDRTDEMVHYLKQLPVWLLKRRLAPAVTSQILELNLHHEDRAVFEAVAA